MIIGNLTKDAESRVTQTGKSVCNFTVAVTRRHGGEQETDFFRVTAWNQLSDICAKFLKKGKKVYVSGPASVTTFKGQDGSVKASVNITADEVEFLSPKEQEETKAGYVEVTDEGLPF